MWTLSADGPPRGSAGGRAAHGAGCQRGTRRSRSSAEPGRRCAGSWCRWQASQLALILHESAPSPPPPFTRLSAGRPPATPVVPAVPMIAVPGRRQASPPPPRWASRASSHRHHGTSTRRSSPPHALVLTASATRAARMSGIDLIVEAPWIIFGAAVLAICIRLLRARPARRQPERAPLPSSDPAGPVKPRMGSAAGQSLSRPHRAAGTRPGRHETASPGPVPRGSVPRSR